MNLRILIEAFNLNELNQLSMMIHERRIQWAKENMVPLTLDEKILVDMGYTIEAIKQYRNRQNCSLVEAKTAIDSYRQL